MTVSRRQWPKVGLGLTKQVIVLMLKKTILHIFDTFVNKSSTSYNTSCLLSANLSSLVTNLGNGSVYIDFTF